MRQTNRQLQREREGRGDRLTDSYRGRERGTGRQTNRQLQREREGRGERQASGRGREEDKQ